MRVPEEILDVAFTDVTVSYQHLFFCFFFSHSFVRRHISRLFGFRLDQVETLISSELLQCPSVPGERKTKTNRTNHTGPGEEEKRESVLQYCFLFFLCVFVRLTCFFFSFYSFSIFIISLLLSPPLQSDHASPLCTPPHSSFCFLPPLIGQPHSSSLSSMCSSPSPPLSLSLSVSMKMAVRKHASHAVRGCADNKGCNIYLGREGGSGVD